MKIKIVLAIIFLFFLVTRVYKIAEIPPSVYWDEASIGYNAFSIATDLKDEWGNFLPIHFRAFGEFKLPVYIYSVVPFVKTFGLNAAAVRLPAVLYTLGTLIVVYLLTKKITDKLGLAVLSAFILSVGPWLFIFSRTGYEATAGLFFFLLATYLLLFVKKKETSVVGSIIFFIASFYSYNSFRLIIPPWLVVLFVYRFQSIKIIKKNVWLILASIAIFLISLIPVYRLYKYDAGAVRLSTVEIKSPEEFMVNYLSHFSPSFLFIRGDTNPRSQMPGHGELYWLDLPLVLAGIWMVVKSKKFYYHLPILMILLAFVPAALTRESPHALRSILAAPGFAMLSAFGAGWMADYFKKSGIRFLYLTAALYLIFFGFYYKDFLQKYPFQTASDWQYQYKQIFKEQKSGLVTDQYAQPYIFALFYQKIPPLEFRSTVKYNPVDRWGFSTVAAFNGFQFK